MKNKKAGRYLLLAGLIVVLVAVGCINYFISSNAEKNQSAAVSSSSEISGALQADDLAAMADVDDFAVFKQERASKRETEISYLDTVINNDNSDADDIKAANERRMAIVAAMEAETTIEGLIVASCDVSNAIVTVQDGSVNVVLDATSITSEQAAKVLEIVQQETDEPAQNIKILLQ